MKNLNQYVGEKVKGVEFESRRYRGIAYVSKMDKHIGHEGVITEYSEIDNSFRVEFETPVKDYWIYPVEVLLPQLEEELIGYLVNDDENPLLNKITELEKQLDELKKLVKINKTQV